MRGSRARPHEAWRRTIACAASFALLLALPVISATHQGPVNWGHPFTIIRNEQTNFFLEAATATSDPFISLNESEAGAASHYFLDASPTSGPSASVASFQSGTPTQTWEVKMKQPLPQDYFLNLSMPILGSFYFGSSASPVAAQSPVKNLGGDQGFVRFEVYADAVLVGGAEDVFHLTARTGPWPWIDLIIWPETRALYKGQVLSFKITRSGGIADFAVGTGGDHQTFLDIRYYSVDPLADGVYLENRQIRSYDGPVSKPGTASSDAPLTGAALIGLVAAFRPRLGRRAIAALLVGVLLSSGCIGAGGKDARPEASADPTATVIVDFENRTELKDRGAIEGVVKNDIGFFVAGAHVAILGTNFFEESDKTGAFAFSNLSAGRYTMRIDAKSYYPLEQQVEVQAGAATRLEVILAPVKERATTGRPHVHGDWGDASVLELQNLDFTYEFKQCPDDGDFDQGAIRGIRRCQQLIPIKVEKPVPAGTARVEVLLKWSDGSNVPKALGLKVNTAIEKSLGVSVSGHVAGFGTSVPGQRYHSRASGIPFNIAIFPTEADPGHQAFTNWVFWVRPSMQDIVDTTNPPATASFSIHVEMRAHKGVVPFEPAHRDFWGANSTINLVINAPRTQSSTATSATFPGTYNWVPAKDRFVPPGTMELRGKFKWVTGTVELTSWKLVYKPGNVPASQPVFFPVELQGTGTERTFVIKPLPEQVDQFYQTQSNWRFYVDDDGQAANSGPGTTWTLSVEAVKDPAYLPT